MTFGWLEAENICVSRDGRTLLGPLSLRLAGPGITAVIGSNGAGKTSLLRALSGLDRISNGRLCSRAASMGYVAQTPVRLARSCRDNIAYPLRLRGVGRAAARKAADAIAEEFDLSAQLSRAASALSAGQAQKMSVARALILKPNLLFLDEPCANLDGEAKALLEARLRRERQAGHHIALTTHDLAQAARLADTIVVLHKGNIAEQGSARHILDRPAEPVTRAILASTYLR